jgi:DNA sulfur modification protein DndD
MILKHIEIENFGIFGGQHNFALSPNASERFNQPIVLLRGSNGVGKSTMVEAIRLCLHGSLSIGVRVGQREYETYLRERLHQSKGQDEPAQRAVIRLVLEHVSLGRTQEYTIERAWSRQGSGISCDVRIWEDSELLNLADGEEESILRELVPPGIAELFFFDGEKIETLAEAGEDSNILLADAIKSLLGLHLIEQLDRDLEIYLTRQSNAREIHVQQMELKVLASEEAELEEQVADIRFGLVDVRTRLGHQRKAIQIKEQELASLGGSFVAKQSEHQAKCQRIEASITAQEQVIFDLFRDLAPYTVAPKLLQAARKRLKMEGEYDRWSATQAVLVELKAHLEKASGTDAYWQGISNKPDNHGQHLHLQRLDELIAPYMNAPMDEGELVHRVSEETRGRLLDWIDQALITLPSQIATELKTLEKLEEQLNRTKKALNQTPPEDILVNVQTELRQLERELGHIEAEHERLVTEDKRLQYLLERNVQSRRRVSEQIAHIETDEGKLQLAARTKLLLADYQEQLLGQKLHQVEERLVVRFNQLCRKRNFIDQVSIDPRNYGVVLYRHGKAFPRHQLSAGEQQLFAIATLWALREVSGLPLPVIIDTPLSRLDKAHRQSMIEEFFPQAAHQVIILATDAEIDNDTYHYMQPAISQAYQLSEQPDTGKSQVIAEQTGNYQTRIKLEDIEVNA